MPAPRSNASAQPIKVAAGSSCADAVAAAGLKTAGPHTIVVVQDPDGHLRDLDWVPDGPIEVVPVPLSSPDGLNVLRHSTAHVLAQAVQQGRFKIVDHGLVVARGWAVAPG